MRRMVWLSAFVAAMAGAFAAGRVHGAAPGHGSMIQHDADVAKDEPGTHNGGGQTIGYSFFAKAPNLPYVFRKRALHPGSGVGLHTQAEDEVYYVLSGKGEMTLDGEPHAIGPGTAILTRTGSSHSLKQMGAEDLVIIITYPIAPAR